MKLLCTFLVSMLFATLHASKNESPLNDIPPLLMQCGFRAEITPDLENQLRAFCQRPENITQKYAQGQSALQLVLPWGIAAARILLTHGANRAELSRPLFDGRTPLQQVRAAGFENNQRIIAELIALGAQEQAGA